MNEQEFPIEAVLSVTTGILFPIAGREGNGMGGIYEVVNFMTGDSAYTTQLGRFCDEVKPYIFNDHEWLRDLHVPIWDDIPGATYEERIAYRDKHDIDMTSRARNFVDSLKSTHGETILLRSIPMDDHDVIDGLEEFKQDYPDIPIIAVDVTEDEPPVEGDINWKVE